MEMPPLTVAILAGGRASRLGGRDKGMERLAGRPLIEWVVQASRQMGAALPLLIIANRHRQAYAAYAPTLRDSLPGFAGPLAGIATALAGAATPWLLTLPVDCPTPPADLAARLVSATSGGDGPAWVAHDGERRQPLFALYRTQLAASAERAAQSGQGVWQWQDAIGARELDFSDRQAQFRNLNTAGDFLAHADTPRSTP